MPEDGQPEASIFSIVVCELSVILHKMSSNIPNSVVIMSLDLTGVRLRGHCAVS